MELYISILMPPNSLLDSVLSVPQEAAMLIAGGIATLLYLLCGGVLKGKRCNTSRLLMFVTNAAGMVTGVYVFCSALKYALAPHKGGDSASYQNPVWAGLCGLAVAALTLDNLIKELRSLRNRTVDPKLTHYRLLDSTRRKTRSSRRGRFFHAPRRSAMTRNAKASTDASACFRVFP